MKITHVTLATTLLLLAQGTAAATIENVYAEQRPKSYIVDIYYDLVDSNGGLWDISVAVEGGGDKPTLSTLDGDVGVDLTPGRNKHIAWDAGTDWPENLQSNFVATVTATPSMGMVLVPGGSNSGRDPYTETDYSLSVESFYMDRTEVTYVKWKCVYDWAVKHGYAFENVGGSKGERHPVQKVNWYDCVKWCNARSEMSRRDPVYRVGGEVYRTGTATPSVDLSCDGYRLPTSEEWEYAARGGRRSQRFPWGARINHTLANYYNLETWYPTIEYPDKDNNYHPLYSTGGYPYTAPVSSFQPNDYGLYEMIGNVGEWVDTDSDSSKLIRGGSWGKNGKQCSIGCTQTAQPGSTNYSIGFRSVRRK